MTAPSLADVLERQCARVPDGTAFICGSRRHTYGSLDRAADQVAHALVGDGVRPGQRVAFWGRNCLEALELIFGAAKAGAVPVMVNWRLSAREAGFILADSESRVIVVDPAVAATEPGVVRRAATLLCTGPGGTFETWSDAAAPTRLARQRSGGPSEVALQLYTSGTTGKPKGVLLTHANVNASTAAHCAMLEMDERSVQLMALPLFHIGGLILALASVYSGSVTIVAADSDPRLIVEAVRQHGVSHLPTVPTLLAAVLDVAEREGTRMPSLRAICYGSAPMSVSSLGKAMSMLDAELLSGYGMTESTATVTFLDFQDHRLADTPDASLRARHRLRSVGKVGPRAEIKIVDPHTLVERPLGEHGEVLIGGTQVMAGYWNRPGDTAETLLPGGWIRTGDGGYLDEDGYLFLTDRIKDMIITGGENVYPAEIEKVIGDMPGIAEVAVIGVPDERWGETPKVLGVRRPGADLTDADVIAHCRATLAHYKCPSTVQWLDALPRTASGKVMKHVLREREQGTSDTPP